MNLAVTGHVGHTGLGLPTNDLELGKERKKDLFWSRNLNERKNLS